MKQGIGLLVILSLMWISVCDVCAQEHPVTFLKKLRQANNVKMTACNYTVQLIDVNNNLIKDSVNGKLYRSAECYLDSNNVFIAGSTTDYFFSLDLSTKKMLIAKIADMKKQLGISAGTDASGSVISIPDSLVLKYGKIENEIMKNGNFHVTITFSNIAFSKVEFEVDKLNYRVNNILIESFDDPGEYGVDMKRSYRMYDFQQVFDPAIISTDRFFTKSGQTLRPTAKYSQYQINTITNQTL